MAILHLVKIDIQFSGLLSVHTTTKAEDEMEGGLWEGEFKNGEVETGQGKLELEVGEEGDGIRLGRDQDARKKIYGGTNKRKHGCGAATWK